MLRKVMGVKSFGIVWFWVLKLGNLPEALLWPSGRRVLSICDLK